MNVAIGAASIVQPQGFSGSLPVMFSMCYKLCDFIQANKNVLFCSAPVYSRQISAATKPLITSH